MNTEQVSLTVREWNELQWFIHTVLGWKSGGPYGDGENIVEKKAEAFMQEIAQKIATQRAKKLEGAAKLNKAMQAFAEANYDQILKKAV